MDPRYDTEHEIEPETALAPDPQPEPAPLPDNRSRKLRLIPLGGLGDIGMNMMVFEYGTDMFAIDCGQMFADEELLGVDSVIPDIHYIVENRHRFRGVVLTHGHEDHIGGLPYLLQKVSVPVYGSPLTLGLLREKLKEFGLDREVKLIPVHPEEKIRLGGAELEFISVTHSIPDALAVAIRLPFGTIIHTGDYKIDMTPPDGRPFDFHTFARYGEEGVLALLADSTNVEREGTSGSEMRVVEPISKLFEQATRTIIFSCFSSSLHRIQQVLDLARKHKRKVFVTGRSMIRNIRIAAETGVLYFPGDLVYDARELKRVPPHERIILTTGSQGEPLSALSRMSLEEHQHVTIEMGDYVILSSRIIPGNEKAIYRMINHFFRRGAEVFYSDVANVHVSGHACREEMRLMINLCRPKYLIPIHGEFRHLVEHKHLAVEMGLDPEKIFILQNGDVIEMDADGAARGGKIDISRILVDGRDVGSVDEVVLRDRRHLAEDGMVIAILAIEQATGTLVSGPDLVSRGFLYMDENQEFFDRCRQVVLDSFNNCEKESREEWAVVKTAVRQALKKFIKGETGRFPVILPVVLEI